MADIVDKATRSRMMAGIRGRNTAPELALRREMHVRGFRFRVHRHDLPARPDLVFPKYRAAVLVHGCFWHRHRGCHFTTTPSTNKAFWREKFSGNVARDRRNLARLQEAGWRTAVVWECELRKRSAAVADRLETWLRSQAVHTNIPVRPFRRLRG
jgi:DNA mismatch endonuclease, patch repair protein